MLLWLAAAATAEAQSADAAPVSRSEPAFYLVAFLCLFGYLIYNNYVLGSRIDELRSSLRREETGPAVAGFRWNELGDERGGLPLFDGLPAVDRSGLHLLGSRDDVALSAAVASVIRGALSNDATTVLLVSQRVARDAIGRLLLSLEAGAPWEGLAPSERARLRQRLQADLEKYETRLLTFDALDWTPEALLAACTGPGYKGAPVGTLIVDDASLGRLPAARAAEQLDLLRRVALKLGAPVVVVVSTVERDWGTWQGLSTERPDGLIEAVRTAERTASTPVRFVEAGRLESGPSLPVDADTGQAVTRA